MAAEDRERHAAGQPSPGEASRRAATWAGVLAIGLLLGVADEALGQPAPDPSASAAAASGLPAVEQLPLPELPKLAEAKVPPATPAAVAALEARLEELRNVETSEPVEPKVDLAFLTRDLDPGMTAAAASRLAELRERLDGKRAVALLDRARELGRKALRKLNKKGAKKDEDGDWLQFVLALGKRDDETWQDSVELYGLLRVLEAVGDTPAVRLMLETYSSFGDLVKIDLQRAIARLRDRAVPALLEARQHDAKKVSRWARSQLDALGKEIPGEAVQTTDAQVLADVLRAFGRTRDVEATGVILSFCNSERIALREAAREAVAAIGKPAEWQLEDAYQSLTGAAPPRAWSWDRTARELFRLFDRARLEKVYEQMQSGVAASGEKRWADAVAAFDDVLAFDPLFERRSEMAPAYFERAEELGAAGDVDEALELWRKSLRLAPEAAGHERAEARVAYHEARALADAGTPDVALTRRAAELDPGFAPARELLAALDEKTVAREKRSRRYVYAGAVGLAALVALVLLARRPRGGRRDRPAAPRPPAPKPAVGSAPGADEAPPAVGAVAVPVAPTIDLLPTSYAVDRTVPWSGATPATEQASVEPEPPTRPPESDAAPTIVVPPCGSDEAARAPEEPPSDTATTRRFEPALDRGSDPPVSGPPAAVLTPRKPPPDPPRELD